ncbi:MAG: LysE family translocator [Thermoflexales bacterium]
MWGALIAGVTLGLSAGFSPGPLSLLVISQSLRFGAREGARVALAPLVTDAPIVLLALLLVRQVAGNAVWFGVLGLVGAGFVAYLAWETSRVNALPDQPGNVAPRSLLRGVLVNLLSPHPWLFWISVGAPLVLHSYAEIGAAAAAAFMLGFYTLLIGSKMLIAWVTERSRSLLRGAAYRWLMRALGVALAVFAVLLLRDALQRLGVL